MSDEEMVRRWISGESVIDIADTQFDLLALDEARIVAVESVLRGVVACAAPRLVWTDRGCGALVGDVRGGPDDGLGLGYVFGPDGYAEWGWGYSVPGFHARGTAQTVEEAKRAVEQLSLSHPPKVSE